MRSCAKDRRVAGYAYPWGILLWLSMLAPSYSQTGNELNLPVEGVTRFLAVQADGKILLGGSFVTPDRKVLIRLNPDGTQDITFDYAGREGALHPSTDLVIQRDGKLLIGSMWPVFGRDTVVQFYPDGRLDGSFHLESGFTRPDFRCMALQLDGKILVGGFYTIRRYHSDGSLDPGFQVEVNELLQALTVQADGKVLVSSSANDGMRLRRFNSDGTMDDTFKPAVQARYIESLAMQPDGKIILSTQPSLTTKSQIVRLHENGSLDPSFQRGIEELFVSSLALQADGKIVVGGKYSTNNLFRLNPDGSQDASFKVEFTNNVDVLILQADGNILIGSWSNERQTLDLSRINSPGQANRSLNFDGSAITWLRGGSSPEILRASFDLSTNGVDWINLGMGERISGGWQLTGISFPDNSRVRAQGIVGGSFREFVFSDQSGSWRVEDWFGPPAIIHHPAGAACNAGDSLTLHVTGGSALPVTYQWRKDGVDLRDGGQVTGAQTPILVLTGLLGADAGNYSVTISSSAGSVTSGVAVVSVIEPFITAQPTHQEINAGDDAVFKVSAIGTTLSYQWRKNSVALSGQTAPSLAISNAIWEDAGLYDVIISSRFGMVTSTVVWLNVNLATADSWKGEIEQPYSLDQAHDATPVFCLAEQTDGKILVGGLFKLLNGELRENLGRFHEDGRLDTAFSPRPGGAVYPGVYSMAMQPDGKILLGGSFLELAGQPRPILGRLNSDGTLDTSFHPDIMENGDIQNSGVSELLLQPDGKILVASYFAIPKYNTTMPSGMIIPPQENIYVRRFARLHPGGARDSTFWPALTESEAVDCIALQRDGKILVGGSSDTNGFLYRLDKDGRRDASFSPKPDRYVYGLLLQPDGKILAYGSFTSLGGKPCRYLGRLHPDGSLDDSFNTHLTEGPNSLALQADGRILIGDLGSYSQELGEWRGLIQRLNADGSWDDRIRVSANQYHSALALLANGKILVGGKFTIQDGQPRLRLARVNNPEPATQSLSYDGTRITWHRGGSSPEFWRATFEYSTHGTDWITLGEGHPIIGGWQFTGAVVPAGATLKARGYVSGGRNNNSTWFVESILRSSPLVVNHKNLAFSRGHFGFQLEGLEGQKTVIEYSTDFIRWTPIWTNHHGQVPAHFLDPESSAKPMRFYRALLAP